MNAGRAALTAALLGLLLYGVTFGSVRSKAATTRKVQRVSAMTCKGKPNGARGYVCRMVR